jgi:E3 ubiquitin-protein ligase TRIP12
LEKISVEFPGHIVREGGLTACLTYLDFFATSVQRTAVSIAANCCRNIPSDSFHTVLDVMPILRGVLGTSDQKVLEQACLCVCRITECFRHQDDKLEQLVSEELLQAILRLLLPGTTNLISPKIHTMFLRALAFTARASPDRAVALIKMNVVDTLYQILTGVSPPSGVEGMANKIDSVMIMQSLIHRPKDQVLETLNVVCELLPPIPNDGLNFMNTLAESGYSGPELLAMAHPKKSSVEARANLLKSCKDDLRRFAVVLLPTLTDAYSSTVNLGVRQKVLTAQLKMLSNIDTDILEEALNGVSYSSFLAAIISQGDNPILVVLALQAAEVLIRRLEPIYQYQFFREGVFSEITKLSNRKITEVVEPKVKLPSVSTSPNEKVRTLPIAEPVEPIGDLEMEFNDGHDEDNDDDAEDDMDEDDENDENEDNEDGMDDMEDEMDEDDDENRAMEEELEQDHDGMDSESDDYQATNPYLPSKETADDMITKSAKMFTNLYLDKQSTEVRNHAAETLTSLQSLVNKISATYGPAGKEDTANLFKELASYFGQDSLASVTSYELLSSKVVDVLLDVFSETSAMSADARTAFLQAFMGQGTQTKEPTANSASPDTPFSVLVHKLQDLLSRAEHFEVITAHSSSSDNSRGGFPSSLSRQVRLRLVADDEVSQSYNAEMTVSVHALATLKSISDFLRTRLIIPDRNRDLRRQGVSGSMAAFAQAISRRMNSGSSRTGGAIPPPFPTLPSQDSAQSSLSEMRRELSLAGKYGLNPPPPFQTPTSGSGLHSPPSNVFGSNSELPSPSPAPVVGSATTSRPSSAGNSDAKSGILPMTPSKPDELGVALGRRRSLRNKGPPPNESERTETLECADETQIDDDEDDTMLEDDSKPISRVATQPSDAMTMEGTPVSPAVNFEIESTGKLTARQEDGTRISTPLSTSSGAIAPPPSGSALSRTLAASTPTLVASSAPAASTGATPATASSSRDVALTQMLERMRAYRSSPAGAGGMPFPPSTGAGAIAGSPSSPIPDLDFHLEFYINDEKVDMHASVYRVLHFSQANSEVSTRTLLNSSHTIKYKRVSGPAPPEPSIRSLLPETPKPLEDGLPASLAEHPTTASILRLLSLLHGMNSHIDDVLTENPENSTRLVAEPLSQFVNTKLTAKLNRQLEEPLIVASSCLPSWSEDLSRFYPFLFPFETRHLFLRSTSFGFARSLARWQNEGSSGDSRSDRARDERQFLGRLQRQKVRVQRVKIFESAVKVMEMYGSSPSILEVEFFDEVGTGLGPTLEFYALVSKEAAKKKLKIWRMGDGDEKSQYVFSKTGLFPSPMSESMKKSSAGAKILGLFTFLGKFLARSMLDGRIVDIHFNSTFFRVGNEGGPTSGNCGDVTPSLGAVESVDDTLAMSLRPLRKAAMQKKKIEADSNLTAEEKAEKIAAITISGVPVEDLALDFTLPGYPDIELIPKGADVTVTIDNVDTYVDRVMDMTLGSGVIEQVKAFRSGFSQVFPYEAVQAFTPDELVMLFGQVDEDWGLETLMDSIKADHGFNLDSKSVRNLLQVMAGYDAQNRREFLQFITGSPKLPIGGKYRSILPLNQANLFTGFKSLTPMLTVVCKPSEPGFTSDDYLPSVMTCVNYLKLPDYSSLNVMKEKLGVAIKEGQGAFHLS